MRLRRSWPYCPSCSASPPAHRRNAVFAQDAELKRRRHRRSARADRRGGARSRPGDGLKVKLVEFSDFIQPNAALDAKELDLNIYQHKPFLDAQNKARGYHLVPVATAVVQQMGIYSKRVSKLDDLQPGAKVAIPNDPTNGARALLVLQAARLITLAGRDRDRLAVRYRRESQEPEVHRDRGRAAAALAQGRGRRRRELGLRHPGRPVARQGCAGAGKQRRALRARGHRRARGQQERSAHRPLHQGLPVRRGQGLRQAVPGAYATSW